MSLPHSVERKKDRFFEPVSKSWSDIDQYIIDKLIDSIDAS